MFRRRAAWLSLVLAGAVAIAWWVQPQPAEDALNRVSLSQASQFTHWNIPEPTADRGTRVVAVDRGGIRSPDEVQHVLFGIGSLRGTELDGEWGVDAQGQLNPGRALRRRFDQLLTTQGEVSLDELTGWLRSRLHSELGSEAAQAVLQVWEKYLLLEGQAYRYEVRLDDPNSIRWALQERQHKRRAVLGVGWADAFFADEEAILLKQLEARDSRLVSAQPSSSAGMHAAMPHLTPEQAFAVRATQLNPEAAQRLADLDKEENLWQQRLAGAQAQWKQTSQAAHLSTAQQHAAFAQWLDIHFSATERLRVQALLGL